jgi:hypothetical protein
VTKRGEPLPINQALNRPRAKLGLDLTAWMARLIIRKHPKMVQLWGLSLNQKSYYDPRKY